MSAGYPDCRGFCFDCRQSTSGLCPKHRPAALAELAGITVNAVPKTSPFSLQSQQAAVLKALLAEAPPDKNRLRVSWKAQSGELMVDYVRRTSRGYFAFGASLTGLLTAEPGVEIHTEWVF